MTFNEALTGAKDTDLDISLRSKYVELIIGMLLYVSYVLLHDGLLTSAVR